MSSILDALEKAQRERGSDAPRLSESATSTGGVKRQYGRYIIGVVVLVTLLGGTLVWYEQYFKVCGDCGGLNELEPPFVAEHDEASLAASDEVSTTDIAQLYEAKLPTINELPSELRDALTPFNYQAHMFSIDTNRGFVMIDGSYLSVGHFVGGAQIQVIDEGGMILKFRGVEFRVEALQGFEQENTNGE